MLTKIKPTRMKLTDLLMTMATLSTLAVSTSSVFAKTATDTDSVGNDTSTTKVTGSEGSFKAPSFEFDTHTINGVSMNNLPAVGHHNYNDGTDSDGNFILTNNGSSNLQIEISAQLGKLENQENSSRSLSGATLNYALANTSDSVIPDESVSGAKLVAEGEQQDLISIPNSRHALGKNVLSTDGTTLSIPVAYQGNYIAPLTYTLSLTPSLM